MFMVTGNSSGTMGMYLLSMSNVVLVLLLTRH